MEAECPHGSLPGVCPPCQRRDPRFDPVEPVASTTAMFEGTCPGCGGPIEPGDAIRRWDDGEPWLCEEC